MPNLQIYTNLFQTYASYIDGPPLLNIETDPTTNETIVSLSLKFVNHPQLGSTKFRVREWYDSSDNLYEYRYCWEVNRRPSGNISAFENEPHPKPHGTETDPHHHHHVLFDRKPVQANPSVRSLQDAFNFVMQYVQTGKNYP